MIKLEIRTAKKFKKQEALIKNIPARLFEAVDVAMDSVLSLILMVARKNVTGGIIGGDPRRDGREGLLAESLTTKKEKKGRNLHGFVLIPKSSPGWYPGMIQEIGYGPIELDEDSASSVMAFWYGGKTVFATETKGVPASHWLQKSYIESKGKAKATFKSTFEKIVKKITVEGRPMTIGGTHYSTMVTYGKTHRY